MCNAGRSVLVIVLLPLAWSSVFACGACIRDIRGPEVTDALDWERSNHVFVARILSSSRMPSDSEEGVVTFRHEYKVLEVLKGKVTSGLILLSQRSKGPSDGVEEHSLCGHVAVAIGDEVLVFVADEKQVLFRHCGASRVLTAGDEGTIQSLDRLRSWIRNRGN